jgi:hypothetical protein
MAYETLEVCSTTIPPGLAQAPVHSIGILNHAVQPFAYHWDCYMTNTAGENNMKRLRSIKEGLLVKEVVMGMPIRWRSM